MTPSLFRKPHSELWSNPVTIVFVQRHESTLVYPILQTSLFPTNARRAGKLGVWNDGTGMLHPPSLKPTSSENSP